MNWIKNLFTSKKKQDEFEAQKSAILNKKQQALDTLRDLNKRFRLTIESGQIEVVIKDINEIVNKK